MPQLKDVARKLKISKIRLSKWCNRGLVACTPSEEDHKTKWLISEEELERLQAMMYPYGLPSHHEYPLTMGQISRALGGVIKTSWLPHLVEWGMLKAGTTPAGGLVVCRAKEVKEALTRLAAAHEVFQLCAKETAHSLAVVKAKQLLDEHLNNTPEL